MEEIKVPVTEEVAENVVEQATEEPVVVEEPKMYTEAEFNAKLNEVIPKKIERAKAKIRKEFEDEYSAYKKTEAVLNAGLGTSNIEEATERMAEFYRSKGVDIPDFRQPTFSENDLKFLASKEAQEIIDYGIEDVIEETNRLAAKGYENMNPREKLVFQQLSTHRKDYEDNKELASIGVTKDALQEADYVEFAKNLNPSLSAKQKYEMYLKYKPKKEVEVIGSMKNATEETGVKDYYSYEEAMKFTKADFDKNPALFKAVERSMTKWK